MNHEHYPLKGLQACSYTCRWIMQYVTVADDIGLFLATMVIGRDKVALESYL